MRDKILHDIRVNYEEGMTLSDFIDTVEYTRGKLIYRFDGWADARVKAGVYEANRCPNCDSHFDRLSYHWNKCGEPEISKYKKDIITGAFMSDATISEDGSMSIYNSNQEFLEWLDAELGFMSYGVYLNDAGEDRKQRNIKSGFDVERESNYKDIYRMKIPVHRFTKELRKLYKKDGKELYTLELSPNIIKIWYCGDGGLNWDDNVRAYPEIRAISQSDYDDEIEESFKDYSFDVSVTNGNIRIYSDADEFLDTIGPAPKGMEYKWENKDRSRYNALK